MNLILDLVQAGHAPRRLTVTKSLATIGRSSQCDVRIAADSVSSRHATIKRYQAHVVVEDIGSTNGLLVNGNLIHGPAIICDGDEIQVGAGGPILAVVAGAGVSSASVRSAASASDRRPAGSHAGRVALIASALFGIMLFLTAGAATLMWFVSTGRNRLEIASITDPRLSQAVGMVICGADLVIDGEANESVLSSGTAFVVTSDGFLVTNRHVIEGFNGGVEEVARKLFETFPENAPEEKRDELKAFVAGLRRPRVWVALNGKFIGAEVKMISEVYDLAVLKIDRQELPYFALSTQEVGRLTEVTAMGFPEAASDHAFSDYDKFEKFVREKTGKGISRFFKPSDLEFTQTQGKVSKLTEEASMNSARKITWIQHTASIHFGNSGGPLCLIDGVVVGVNTQGSTADTNMKFSFSAHQVREELEAVTGKLSWR